MKIRSITFWFLSLPVFNFVMAQETTFLQGELNIMQNTIVGFYGDLENDSGSIFNMGDIYLYRNLKNNNSLNDLLTSTESGSAHFTGSFSNELFSNPGSIQFFKLNVDKTSQTVKLNTNITILNNLSFTNSNLYLNGKDVILDKWYDNTIFSNRDAILLNEHNSSKIFGETGFVKTNKLISNTTLYNPGNLGLVISTINNYGYVDIDRGHKSQQSVSDGSIRKHFDVSPSFSGYNSSIIRIIYLDSSDFDSLNAIESDFKMWRSSDRGVTYVKIGNSFNDTFNQVDTIGNYVEVRDYPFDSSRLTVSDEHCIIEPDKNLDFSYGDTQFVCQYTSLTLDAGNPGLDYIWNTTETTQSITVTETSILDTFERWVLVTNPNGCYRFDTVLVIIVPKPQASFIQNDTCLNDTIFYSNLSTIAYGTLDYWWDFSDGINSTLQHPEKLFPMPDTFPTTLVTTSDFGCLDTFFDPNVHVFPRTMLQFNVTDICDDYFTGFTNNSSIQSNIKGGNTIKAYWNFGDGRDTTIIGFNAFDNLTHLYDSADVYLVKLVHETVEGCKDSAIKAATVFPLPQTDFDVVDVCLNEHSFVTNKTSIKYGTVSFNWDFGDSSYSNVASLQKTYLNPGTYNIKLIATSDKSCQDSITKQTIVFPLPQTSFSFNNACNGSPVLFADSSTISSGTLSRTWFLGDGSTSTSLSLNKIYTNYGDYYVKLVNLSNEGCGDSISKTVSVYPVPYSNFITDDACLGDINNFINASGIPQGTIISKWDFDDGDTSILTNPSHIYLNTGNYNIKLITTSDKNCADSISKSITINSLPVINLGGTIQTCGDKYELDALNPGSNYLWSTAERTQKIMVSNDGSYFVTVTDSIGCENYDTVQVLLNTDVEIDLGPDRAICDQTILDAGYPGSTYQWNTSDITQTINVGTTGFYKVTVTDQNNCLGEDSVQITVNNSPIVDIGNDTATCSNNPVVLDAGNSGFNYLWQNSSSNRTVTVSNTGNWWVRVTDPGTGCSGYDTAFVTLHNLPAVNLGNDFNCCGHTILDAQNAGDTYLWSDFSTNQTLVVTASNTYWVNVTNDKGCMNSDSVDIIVHPDPLINFPTDTSICAGQLITLDAGNPGATYSWSNNSTTRTLTAATQGILWVDVTNTYGCSVRDSVSLLVNAIPTVEIGSDMVLCKPQNLVLNAGNPGASYQWGSSTGKTGISQYITADSIGKYWVEVTDSNGCTNFDSINIILSDYPIIAKYYVASKVRELDTIQFINISYPTLNAIYFWNFGDNKYSVSKDPTHRYESSGIYIVKLIASNGSCNDTLAKTMTVELRDGGPPIPEGQINLIEIIHSNLYPNPNNGNFRFEIEFSDYANMQLYLFNLQGQLIYNKQILNTKSYENEYNYEFLKDGIYIFKVIAGHNERIYKIIKL